MPTLPAGRVLMLALQFAALTITVLTAPAADAQAIFGPEAGAWPGSSSSNPQASSGNTSSGRAPLFRLPNFIGDRRVDDLYVYMHETPKQSWDTYRKYVSGLSGQLVNLQPTRQSPSPANIQNTNSAANMITTAGSAAATAASNMTGGSPTGSPAQAASNTSADQQFPESTAPPEALATNYDAPLTDATTSVSGMVVGPGSEIPGLLE